MSHFRLNNSILTSAQRTGRLDLHGRSLYEVPSDVFHSEFASELQILDLSENKIETLPSEIRRLINLKELYLDTNRLCELPYELLELPNLKAISLEGNPQLPTDLLAVYDKAFPIFRSRARDAAPILAWLANKADGTRGGGGGGGGASWSQHREAPSSISSPTSPLQGAGRAIGAAAQPEREYRNREEERNGSYQTQAQNTNNDDDEYIYAQMRARAAARAAAADEYSRAGVNGGYQDAGRDVGRDERREYDNRRDYDNRVAYDDRRDYDDRRSHDRRDSVDRRGDDRASAPRDEFESQSEFVSNVRASSSSNGIRQQPASPASRYSSNPGIAARKESPFALDAGLKMESREQRSTIGSTANNKNPLPLAMQDEQRYGRRAYAAQHSTAAPFGVDSSDSNNGPVPRSAGQRAPFGTDLNASSTAARRVGSSENRSGLVNPWASDDGSKGEVVPAARGVRQVRANDQPRQSPFGTLPPELAGIAYQTSSAAAQDHVQAAVRVRAQGSLDTDGSGSGYGGPSSDRNGGYAPFDDGSITGNGPRNSNGLRSFSRPNSDIFHRGDAREEFRRDNAGGPIRGGGVAGQDYERYDNRDRRANGNDERDHEPRSNSRLAGAAIAGQSSSALNSRSNSRGNSSSGRRSFQAPFARDSDEPPSSQSIRTHGNRSNASTVFDEVQPERYANGRGGGAARPVKETRLW